MYEQLTLTGIVLALGLALTGCAASDCDDGSCEAEDSEDRGESIGVSEDALESLIPPVSEETAPAFCPLHTLVAGAQCTGGYCDNVHLLCRDAPGVQTDYAFMPTFFSEEGMNYQICPSGKFMSGLRCTGGWCDNMNLECVSVAGASSWPCFETGFFSEENPLTSVPNGYAVTGMTCSGPWCDNIKLRYCQITQCEHSVCETGAKLTSGCDSGGVVSSICAVDPYCCNVSWDSICVGEVSSVAGKSCG